MSLYETEAYGHRVELHLSALGYRIKSKVIQNGGCCDNSGPVHSTWVPDLKTAQVMWMEATGGECFPKALLGELEEAS